MSSTQSLSFSRSSSSMLMDFNIGCNCKCPSNPQNGQTSLSSRRDAIDGDNGEYFKTVLCYTPRECASGSISCGTKSTVSKSTMTTDSNLVMIPSNAIIDFVEYYGIDNFSTKEEFNIGLGQLNQRPMAPLLESCSSEIANERCGGRRQFVSVHPDGRNDSVIVLYPSYVNVEFNAPVTRGWLAIVVGYHVKSV